MKPFRTCLYCGLEAFTEAELEKFCKSSRGLYSRRNCCKECKNKARRTKLWPNKKCFHKIIDGVEKKRCHTCGLFQPLKDFSKNHSSPDKLQHTCKGCHRKEYHYYLADKRTKSRLYRRKLSKDVLNYLTDNDPNCRSCSIKDKRVLVVDHINHDGKKERNNLTRTRIFLNILKMPKEEAKKRYQVLCRNCNWIREYERVWM